MSQVFPGYPNPPGGKPWSIADITGPTSYTAVTNGTAPAAPTGGQSIAASFFGLTSLAWVANGMSISGTYLVQAIVVPMSPGVYAPNVILRWVTAATGAEASGAANLSAETVRLLALGVY